MKREALKSFARNALSEYNRVLKEREGCKTFMAFHRKVFDSLKPTGFNSQVKCDLERNAWRMKGSQSQWSHGQIQRTAQLLGIRDEEVLLRRGWSLSKETDCYSNQEEFQLPKAPVPSQIWLDVQDLWPDSIS
jgi:hypothetical protein